MFVLAIVPLLLPALLVGTQVQSAGPVDASSRLWALTTDDSLAGAVVGVRGGPPWSASLLAHTDGGRLLRRFGRSLFAVNAGAGTIRRVAIAGGQVQDYDLGPGSEPQDVHVPPALLFPPLAYVTRRHAPFLLELDLATGASHDVVDLSPVGGGAPIALGTMERDGSRLFVQVRVEDGAEVPGGARGVLAVVDLVQQALIDVDPLAPGIQGIALQGAPPRFKMQLVSGTRTLFVSTTESFLDARGGIERVDVDQLASLGFALTEEVGGSDMGGFVMTSPEEGYYVFHTDLLASTHLKHFRVPNAPDPGLEIVVLLNDTVDVIAHDPARRAVFLPSGFAWGTPGLYMVSTRTNQVVGPPIDTLLRPHDVIVGPRARGLEGARL
ncbi:MAG: hypothetical protein HOP15_09280 [Planctomycetes bacterium]|nr:hypothetical protein [Planctomycetota bacterium]